MRAGSSCSTPPPSPVTTPLRCSACTRRSSSSRSTRTAPTHCRCAASPATPRWRSACRSRTRPTSTSRPTGDGYPVRVDDPAGCPVFAARTVTGFDPSRPTPDWMARRIEQAGMRSISLAVDVTNYVMLELGQPIHGYDRALLQGAIVVRRAEAGEKLTTLDGVVRTLDADDLLITDDRGPIGLAGVMGGAEVELVENTTDVVIEAAHFDPRHHRPHVAAAQAALRGVQALRARRRPELPARASPARRRAARRARRRHDRARPDGRRRRRRAHRGHDRRRPAGPGHRRRHRPATLPRPRWPREVATVTHADGRITLTAAELAVRPHRPVRPRRGRPARRRLRPGPVGAAAGPGRPRPHAPPRCSGAASAWCSPAPDSWRSRRSRSPGRRTSTGSGCPPTTTDVARCCWRTRCRPSSRA